MKFLRVVSSQPIDLKIPTGVIDFYHNRQCNIFAYYPKNTHRTIDIKFQETIAHLVPLSDRKIKLKHIYNYYGMVEQVGSIFVECEEGFLHPPIFSDVIIRDKINLKPLKINNTGIVQVNSCLPKSYPGHILLTEDVGIIHGIDDCKCGRKGKYFSIQRRLKKAELRGCSDTFEE